MNTVLKRSIIIYLFLSLFFSTNIFSQDFFNYPISTIIIDAGHGGKDSGAIASYSFNNQIYEKDIVLDFALKLEESLKEKIPEILIYQTRNDDTYLSLQQRSEKGYNFVLKDKTASLYISIHANSAKNTEAEGFEIYTKLENKVVYLFDETTPIENLDLFVNENLDILSQKQYITSYNLSASILNSVLQNVPTIVNRGIKSEDLYVLNVCRTTGCLIELGFISNEEEAKKLLNQTYIDKMVDSISNGIVNYINSRS